MSQAIIGVHLDLKGLVPKPSYLPQLLTDLADAGVNTLLVEYEDVFPFRDLDIAWDKSVRWSPKLLAGFLAQAQERGLEVIPLQQCLGHLEYVLRWPAFRALSEESQYPSTICLAKKSAKALVFNMLEQVMAAHPASKYVHLGMDEAHGMVVSKRYQQRGVLAVFLEFLDELCSRCEAAGKTPMIWSDMLEDHFENADFSRLKDRVIMTPWEYGTTTATTPVGRLAGFRLSRKWLERGEQAGTPALTSGHKFLEDYPPAIAKVVRPYLYDGERFTAMFQADVWRKLGFRVVGACGTRVSSDGPLLPFYNRAALNTRTWADAVRRSDSQGLIGTSWARGNSFCPPNCPVDVTWPGIVELVRAMGGKTVNFFPGVDLKTQKRLFAQLGRCRDNWRIEDQLVQQMQELAPQLRRHAFEWRSILLMLQTLQLQRRCQYITAEFEFFRSGSRLPVTQWQRRLREQQAAGVDLAKLRKQVAGHFDKRYHGDAYHEWLREIFDVYQEDMKRLAGLSRANLGKARRIFATGPR